MPVSLLDLLPSFSSSNHLLDCVSTGIRSPISCSTYILHITVQHSGIKSVSLYPVSLFIYFLHANKTTQKIFAKYISVTFLSALKKVYHIHIVKTHSNLQSYIYFYIFVSCIIISSYTLWNCHQFLSSICHKSHELPLGFMLI